jgi:hypothetical protein
VAERLFLFTQLELPWRLGPADGRYLVRSERDGEPEWVVVLGTLGASRRVDTRRRPGRLGRLVTGVARGRGRSIAAGPAPAPVTTARATVVDPISLSAERQARARLAELTRDDAVATTVTVINRVLHAHRIATADPHVHEISPTQALVVRVGYGAGEQVADGLWLHARELAAGTGALRARRTGRRGRASALRPEERLAELLGARDTPLLCEELALRARLDLDQGRVALAAIELDRALGAAVAELGDDLRADLSLRAAELAALRDQVAKIAAQGSWSRTTSADEEEAIAHALGRLEAALRARSAAPIT